MDIVAKHVQEHIGILTEDLYQKYLWKHQPLTNATEAEAPRVTDKGKNRKLSPVFGFLPLLFEELLLVIVVALLVVVCLDVVVDGLVVLDYVVLLFASA